MRVSLTAGLTMAMAFQVNLQQTYWALLTLPLVITAQTGTTVWRSAARVGGTLIGALVALVLCGAFAQSGSVMIFALALWIAGCGYLARAETGFDGYAYGTAGLTVLVIAIDTGPNLDLLYGFALSRSTETIIPVIAGLIVMLAILPQSVKSDLLSSFDTARDTVLDLVQREVDGKDLPSEAEIVECASKVDGLFSTIRARRLERANDGSGARQVETATADLVNLFHQSAAIVTEKSDTDARHRLAKLMAEDGSREEKEHALRAFAEEISPPIPPGDAEPSDLREAHHRFRLAHTASAVADQLHSAAAAHGDAPKLDWRKFTSRYFDRSAAVQRGLRPAVAFILVSIIWLSSAWANGSVFVLITGALSLLIPTILPRAMLVPGGKKIGMGFMCGGILALIAIAAFPVMEGIWGFLLLFMPLIFTLFYVARGPNAPIALGATIMFAISFAPSNVQVYDPVRTLNILVTLAMMPVAFIITQTVFFPEDDCWLRRHLRRAAGCQVRPGSRSIDSIAAQGIDVIADYGGDLDMDRQEDAALTRRVRVATLAGTEMAVLRNYAAEYKGPVADHLPALTKQLSCPLKGKSSAFVETLDTLRRDLCKSGGADDARRVIFALIGLRMLAISGQLSEAYEVFRNRFQKHLAQSQGAAEDTLQLHDARVRELETKHRNLVLAVENGNYAPAIIERLNAVDAELKVMKAKRADIVPLMVELPENLPDLYRGIVSDLAASLSDEVVAGRAADELHELVDRIVVDWDEKANGHCLTIEGNFLEMLSKSAPRELDAVRSGAIFAEVGCGSRI